MFNETLHLISAINKLYIRIYIYIIIKNLQIYYTYILSDKFFQLRYCKYLWNFVYLKSFGFGKNLNRLMLIDLHIKTCKLFIVTHILRGTFYINSRWKRAPMQVTSKKTISRISLWHQRNIRLSFFSDRCCWKEIEKDGNDLYRKCMYSQNKLNYLLSEIRQDVTATVSSTYQVPDWIIVSCIK